MMVGFAGPGPWLSRGVASAAMNEDRSRALEALAARRWRIALLLTAGMLVTYFGFVLLVAYDKPLLAQTLTPGLSLGILLGAVVILVAWALTGLYVRWANRVYDVELTRVRTMGPRAAQVDPPREPDEEGS